MSIINGDTPHARETREFARLLIAVLLGRRGIALGEFAVTPLPPGIDLDVVGAVHRLHRKEVPLTGSNAEKLVLEFVPVATLFIEFFFREVRDVHALVAVFLPKFPHEVVEYVAEHGSLRRPERQARADEAGGRKE